MVTVDTPVEKVLEDHPACISYFIQRRLSPFTCAGAFPTTLGDWLRARDVEDVEEFVAGLQRFLSGEHPEAS